MSDRVCRVCGVEMSYYETKYIYAPDDQITPTSKLKKDPKRWTCLKHVDDFRRTEYRFAFDG